MHEYIQTAILGFVQGATEFLPISSDGHLILIREALGLEDQGLAFDAILHLATALAILVYFWMDWKNIVVGLFTKKSHRVANQSRRLIWLIAITTVPAVIAGLAFKEGIENELRGILPTAILMVFLGIMFLVVEKISVAKRDISKLTVFDALSIGLAQAVAILPGISRSGATIMAGMYHGVKREAAARYSFLAGGPIILGAGLYSLLEMLQAPEPIHWVATGIGFGVAFITGLGVIHILLNFLKFHKLEIFAKYLIVVGAGFIIIHWAL